MNSHKSGILSQYTNLQKIGEGLTSVVYKGYTRQKQQVCLKIIDQKFYSKSIGKLLIDNQIKILKQLQHENLLKLKKYQKKHNQNIIVTDYCDGGNLYDMIKKYKQIQQRQMLIILKGIVNGMKYLNDKKIIHRDLKPQNIFFKNGQPIIADFGFAVHLDNSSLNKVNAGSPLYMSPEALKSLQFSIQSDIFSLGVMMYQMLKGKTPWIASSQKQLIQNILKQRPQIQLKNKQLEKLILKCLQPVKSKRAKFQQIFQYINMENIKAKNNTKKQQQLVSESVNKKKTKDNRKETIKLKTNQIKIVRKQQKSLYQLPKQSTCNKQNKQNYLNLSTYQQSSCNIKTDRVSSQARYRNQSFALQQMDGLKTKRNNVKNEKKSTHNIKNNMNISISNSNNKDNDFNRILTRLDPQQMKFLPCSMIEKFKFILDCYINIMERKQGSLVLRQNLPVILKDDKIILQMINCQDQKQLCRSVNGYIGRMYRLAKNYKVYKQFMKDIQVLYNRVESFAA